MQPASSPFFQDPSVTWAFAESRLGGPILAPELKTLPRAYHHALGAISCGGSVPHAFLIGAIADCIDAPPSSIPGLFAAYNDWQSALTELYELARGEFEGGFRAKISAGPTLPFQTRIIANPRRAGSASLDSTTISITVPKYEDLLRRHCPQPAHVSFASAHLTFGRGSLLLSDLSCPLWELLSAQEKDCYQDWPKVLIAAAEQYAIERVKKSPSITGVIDGKVRKIGQVIAVRIGIEAIKGTSFVSEEGMFHVYGSILKKDAAPEHISEEIAAKVSQAGYLELPLEQLAYIAKFRKEPDPKAVLFKVIHREDWQNESGAPGSELRRSIKKLACNRANRWAEKFRALFSELHVSVNSAGQILASQPLLPERFRGPTSPLAGIERCAAYAPVCPKRFNPEATFSKSMAEHHERLMASPMITSVLDRVPRMFIPISAGPRGEARQDWHTFPKSHDDPGMFRHLKDQNRHPSLCFAEALAPGQTQPKLVTMGFKGAGYLDKDGLSFFNTKELKEGELHSPIRRNVKGDGTAHGAWGGLVLEESVTEFRNLLGISWMMQKIAPRLGGAVAEPVDVVYLETFPLWDKSGKIHWYFDKDFQGQALGFPLWDITKQFTCLRTISRSDVRLSQITNRIFTPEVGRPYEASTQKHRVDSALTYLYAVHGCSYQVPQFTLPLDRGRITPHSIAQYLQLASQLQQETAKSLFRRYEARSLVTMASIHSINGHLGGVNLPGAPKLALRGGPLALRNVDGDFRLHDVDHFCRVPLAPGWDSNTPSQGLTMAQALDMLTFRDSEYWMRLVLGQRKDLPRGKLVTAKFGPRFSVLRFNSDLEATSLQSARVKEVLEGLKEKKDPTPLLHELAGSYLKEYQRIVSRAPHALKRTVEIIPATSPSDAEIETEAILGTEAPEIPLDEDQANEFADALDTIVSDR